MPDNLNEMVIDWPVILLLLEFLAIGLLGFVCRQLLIWEMALESGRTAWLLEMRTNARLLRRLRMEIQQMELPIMSFRWRMLMTILRTVSKSRFGAFLQEPR